MRDSKLSRRKHGMQTIPRVRAREGLNTVSCSPVKRAPVRDSKNSGRDDHRRADLSPEKWQADGKHDFSLSWKALRKSLAIKSAPVKIRTSNLLIRSQMLYPVELRAQNLAITYKNTIRLQQQRVVLSGEIPSHNFRRFHTDSELKDRRLTLQVHGRKIFLVPLRRKRGPYYIRF